RGSEGKDISIQYAKFSQVTNPLKFDNDWYRENVRVQHNIFTNIFTGEPIIYIISPSALVQGRKTNFIFSNNSYTSNWGSIFIDNFQSDVMDLQFTDNLLTNNVVYAIKQGDPSNALIYGLFDDVRSKYQVKFSGNSIFGNYQINSSADTIIREVGIGIQGSGESLAIPDNYFRSTDANYISSTFDHFYQNSNLPLLKVEPVAAAPDESVPPHIYKVNLNGKDITNYSTLPPSSSRDAVFEVFFNKPVDAFGDHQFESIVYDTSKNELVINPVPTADNKWSPDHKKYTFRISNASFLNNQVGYVVITNFKDKDGTEVPDFTIGQQKAVNNYRAVAAGGRKSAEIISQKDEEEGLGVDINKGAFLTSKEQVKAFKALTDLGDLSYLGPYESLAKSWEAGLTLGTSNYTGTFTDRFADRDEYHFAGGIYGQYNRHKWYSLRAMIWLGKISGNDISVSSLSDRKRLSEFKNFIVEGSFTFHWHLLPYGTNRGERFVPSVFAGVALFRNNPMSRIFMTLDREGNPRYLRWKDGHVVTDWLNNTDGYNEGKDIWVPLQAIGTEGQTVPGDGVDPEAYSPSADAVFFQNRTAPKQYKKVQVGFPVGVEINWLIKNTWNIGATLGVRFSTTRYLDDIGGYFFDRIHNHQAIVDANWDNIKGKAGREKITLPNSITFTDDQYLTETYYTAALLANPSLVKTNEANNVDPNYFNYAYTIDLPYDSTYDNHDARRAQKDFDNYDIYFFAGLKASYIFKRKGQQKTSPAKTGIDALDTDGDGITDSEEKKMGTNPAKADTDSDGLSDKKESETGSNPKIRDSDKDGIADGKDKCPTIEGSKKNDGCPE
ncbi:MAG TPA: DUF6089 family protein, partial [Chitinophagales bacterium]|nr:DUF6089 family protein [Chitinophagales bacterium]